MEIKKSIWADENSSDNEMPEENIITSLPKIEEPPHKTRVKTIKKRKNTDDAYAANPNLITKLTNNPTQIEEKKEVSRKERKKQELEELDDLLNEFGLTETPQEPSAAHMKEEKKQEKVKKNSKKEIFQNIRSEINARKEKSKKTQKPDKKFPK